MNKLMLNYLCQEGYSAAVKEFEKESGIKATDQEVHAIEKRKEIKGLLLKDCIKEAIGKINELCPEVRPLSTLDTREKSRTTVQAPKAANVLSNKAW